MTSGGHVAQASQRLAALEALQLDLPPAVASGSDLSGDHPLFDLAPEAREAVRAALERGETRYADVPGIASLREAVAAALDSWNLQVDPHDGLVIAAGEQEARFLALQTLAQSGYRLMLPSIVHPGARKASALGHATVDRFPLELTTMTPDLGVASRTLAAGAGALYVESPSRLTGKIIERGMVEALADEARRSDAVVVWDASLADWLPEDTDYAMIGALPGMADRTITIGVPWSGSGVEGWLAAYLAGPPSLLAQASRLKQIIAICTTTPAQWGVLGALVGDAARHRSRLELLSKRKAEASREAAAIVLPGEAVSVLAVRVPQGAVEVASLPARPMPGAPFGAPDILRFTVTPAGEVAEALRTLTASATWRRRDPR